MLHARFQRVWWRSDTIIYKPWTNVCTRLILWIAATVSKNTCFKRNSVVNKPSVNAKLLLTADKLVCLHVFYRIFSKIVYFQSTMTTSLKIIKRFEFLLDLMLVWAIHIVKTRILYHGDGQCDQINIQIICMKVFFILFYRIQDNGPLFLHRQYNMRSSTGTYKVNLVANGINVQLQINCWFRLVS